MSNEEETGYYYIGFKMHKGCLKKNVLLSLCFVLFTKSFKLPSLRIICIEIFSAAYLSKVTITNKTYYF